jgi:protein-disulfide isomerase
MTAHRANASAATASRDRTEPEATMRRTVLAALSILALAASARAQAPADTTRDLAAVRADLARAQADLETIKGQLAQVLRLLSQRQQAAGGVAATGPVRTSVAGAPSLGRADAPVTIVEFSDYQCPFCQRYFATTLPALKKEYVDAGKVRYVFRDHPLDQLHPLARKAAEAAHCAGEQGKFWEMHDALFGHPGTLAPSQLVEHARSIGLDGPKFGECLASGRHAARVERGLADGAAAGVQGTPGFVIGRTKPGDVVEGTPVRGAQPLETFRQIIDRALAQP